MRIEQGITGREISGEGERAEKMDTGTVKELAWTWNMGQMHMGPKGREQHREQDV